jgi:hypothetical protein
MLVILGDSHTIALHNGLAKLDSRTRRAARGSFGEVVVRDLSHGYKFFEPFFELDDQGVRFTDPRAVGILSKLPGGFAPITANDPRDFLFCFGFHPSATMDVKRWLTHTAARSTPGKQYISEALVRAAVQEHTRPMLDFFRLMQKMNVRFSVVMCCPLPRSFITEERRPLISEDDILAYHQLYRQTFAAELDRLGVRYFTPPESTFDGPWLKEDYVNRKGIGDYHADARYGALMLKKIIGALTEGRRVPPPTPREILGGLRRKAGRLVRRVRGTTAKRQAG